jgi:hypothetical protein
VKPVVAAIVVCTLLNVTSVSPAAEAPGPYGTKAREVTSYLQQTFWDPSRNIYTRGGKEDPKPDYVWRQAAAFSVLVGAARHEPKEYRPLMAKHFKGLEAYWDAKAPVPGYEPAPTKGNGNDKYYDDNAWLVISLAEAFEVTGDRAYLKRAIETARFVDSGRDKEGGGGIWWHEKHKDGSKNTCANGPAAVGYVKLAQLGPKGEADAWTKAAREAVDWTRSKLQATDGLYDDRIIVATGEVKHGKLTYNSALMLRAHLGLYRRTGKPEDLAEATRIGKAADWFLDARTGVYRDPLKWSHFMVEADLDLHRATGDEHALARAKTNANAYYAAFKAKPSAEMMAVAGTARILWLLADTETEAGRAFWRKSDAGRE